MRWASEPWPSSCIPMSWVNLFSSVHVRLRSCVRPSANAWAVRILRRAQRGRRWCTWQTPQRCEYSSKPQPKPNCHHRSQICSPGRLQPSPVEAESKTCHIFISWLRYIQTLPNNVTYETPKRSLVLHLSNHTGLLAGNHLLTNYRNIF